jgi:hypothetical protein
MVEFTAKMLMRKEERCHRGHREEQITIGRTKATKKKCRAG